MVPRQIRRIWFPYRGEGPFHSPIHWEPMQCTQRVAISPPRTEERAQRCYTKAGFKHELSRSALWGKEGHHASQWQKWTKVPTWSMWVPTDKLTNIGNSRDAEWFGFFVWHPCDFHFLCSHMWKILADKWENWWSHATDCARSCAILCLFDHVLFWPAMFSLTPHRLKFFVSTMHCNSLSPAALQDVG